MCGTIVGQRNVSCDCGLIDTTLLVYVNISLVLSSMKKKLNLILVELEYYSVNCKLKCIDKFSHSVQFFVDIT